GVVVPGACAGGAGRRASRGGPAAGGAPPGPAGTARRGPVPPGAAAGNRRRGAAGRGCVRGGPPGAPEIVGPRAYSRSRERGEDRGADPHGPRLNRALLARQGLLERL